MDEHPLAAVPVATYALVLLCCGGAWSVLQASLIRLQGPDSAVRRAVGRDLKGKISVAAYLFALAAAFIAPPAAYAAFIGVAVLWLVPDRRLEAGSRTAD